MIWWVILGVLAIAAAQDLAPRVRISPPLVLVVLGVLVGVLPFVPEVAIDPEWILIGVLPPLLYSAAVSMPTMDFRRDFFTIGALSVLLVLISAVILGGFFHVVLGVPLATGVALGAIVSPTDAVATSIAKRLGVPSRVIAVLEGESMLNDASALVLLRAAVAATASTVSFAGVAVNFGYAVAAAVAVGAVVGLVNLRVRARVADATVNTAISFTVPYLAYLPAESLGASGLVAAVTAGLITGAGAAAHLTPQHRVSDAQNWRTVELILEGGVFLVMGLELWGLIADVQRDHAGVHRALLVGFATLALTVLLRGLYVAPLVWLLGRYRRRVEGRRERLENFGAGEHLPERATARISRALSDLDYYSAVPLGRKEAAIITWAGMRGVVTLAAAQTLPAETESRSLLVLIAFIVAASSLLLQGGTLPWVIRRLRLVDRSSDIEAERAELGRAMAGTALEAIRASGVATRMPQVAARLEATDGDPDREDSLFGLSPEQRTEFRTLRRLVIDAQRRELLHLRGLGTYGSKVLNDRLQQLDADEISLDMRERE